MDNDTITPDLSSLENDLENSAQKAREEKKEEQSLWDKLLETFMNGLVNMGVNAMGNMLNKGIDNLMAKGSQNKASKGAVNKQLDEYKAKYGNMTKDDYAALQAKTNPTSEEKALMNYLGKNPKFNSDGGLADSNFSHSQSHRESLGASGAPELNSGASTGKTVEQARKDARATAGKEYDEKHNDKKGSDYDPCPRGYKLKDGKCQAA